MSGVIFCERKHTLINNVNNNIKLFAANWRKKKHQGPRICIYYWCSSGKGLRHDCKTLDIPTIRTPRASRIGDTIFGSAVISYQLISNLEHNLLLSIWNLQHKLPSWYSLVKYRKNTAFVVLNTQGSTWSCPDKIKSYFTLQASGLLAVGYSFYLKWMFKFLFWKVNQITTRRNKITR